MSIVKSGLALSIVGAIATITAAAVSVSAQTLNTNATPEQPLNVMQFGASRSGGAIRSDATLRLLDPLLSVEQPHPDRLLWAGNSELGSGGQAAYLVLDPELYTNGSQINSLYDRLSSRRSPTLVKYGFLPEPNEVFHLGGFWYYAGDQPFNSHGFGRNPQTGAAQFTPFQWRFATGIDPSYVSPNGWGWQRLTSWEQVSLLGPWMDMGVTMDGTQPRFTLPDIQNTRYTFGIDDLWYELELLGFAAYDYDNAQFESAVAQSHAGDDALFKSLLVNEWTPNPQAPAPQSTDPRNGDFLTLVARMLAPTSERNPNATVLEIEVDGEPLLPKEEPQPEKVPEPGLLLGLGAIALGAFRLRRDRL